MTGLFLVIADSDSAELVVRDAAFLLLVLPECLAPCLRFIPQRVGKWGMSTRDRLTWFHTECRSVPRLGRRHTNELGDTISTDYRETWRAFTLVTISTTCCALREVKECNDAMGRAPRFKIGCSETAMRRLCGSARLEAALRLAAQPCMHLVILNGFPRSRMKDQTRNSTTMTRRGV